MLEPTIKEAFRKCDSKRKGYLTEKEYHIFEKNLGESFYIDKSISNLIANNCQITVKDLLNCHARIGIERDMESPALKIVRLLKKVKQMESIDSYLKEQLENMIEEILSGKLYQTELSPKKRTVKSLSSSIIKSELEVDEKREKLKDWMEQFSGPILRVEMIESSKRLDTSPRHSLKRKSLLSFELINDIEKIQKQTNIISRLHLADFNVFECEEAFGRKLVLPIISYRILQMHKCFSILDEKAFENFIKNIQAGYKQENPYHTDLHATDVLQMCHFMLLNGVQDTCRLNSLDVTAFLLSAIIHDFRHPGVNNVYLQNSMSDLAIKFNDKSVLENHHLAEAFQLIYKEENCNIFQELSPSQISVMKRRITGMILGTDNSHHFDHVNHLQSIISAHEIKAGANSSKIINTTNALTEFESKQLILNILLHAADIGNPMRPFKTGQVWARNVTEEFYQQGDREKREGLPVSMFCDREKGNLAASQVGFISSIVKPYIDMLIDVFPKLYSLSENVNRALLEWGKLKDLS